MFSQTNQSVRKKQRTNRRFQLVFELLEQRTLLAAGVIGGHDFNPADLASVPITDTPTVEPGGALFAPAVPGTSPQPAATPLPTNTNLASLLIARSLSPAALPEGESPVPAQNVVSDLALPIVNLSGQGRPTTEDTRRADAATREVFAAMAYIDLLEDQMTEIEELVAIDRVLLESEYESTVEDDNAFATPSLNNRSDSEFNDVESARGLRNGFVDISETIDDLLGETSNAPEDDSDSNGFEPDEVVLLDHANRQNNDGGVIWRLFKAMRGDAEVARSSQPAVEGAAANTEIRNGMVALAHDDVPAATDARTEVDAVEQPDDSFLKMDGEMIRYQAFEIAPVPVITKSEAVPSEEVAPTEQPVADNVSTAAVGGKFYSAARASIAPMILACLWRRRSRRDS